MPLKIHSPHEAHDLLRRFALEVLTRGTADDEILGRYIGEVMGLGPDTIVMEWPSDVPVPPQVTDRGFFGEDL
jgi:hypothetical protein